MLQDIGYDWKDEKMKKVVKSDQEEGQRFHETEDATKRYFDRFKEGIGGL